MPDSTVQLQSSKGVTLRGRVVVTQVDSEAQFSLSLV